MFGGTFDPPHSGHLAVAQAVAQHCEVAKVLFVVAGEPWQKLAAGVAVTPAEDRLALVQALVASVAGAGEPSKSAALFEVSAVELERGGPAYTADTLEELSRMHPDAELLLVIGSDLVSQLETWHEPERVRELASLIVVERPGFENPPLPAGWSGSYLRGELVDISSTQLRGQLGAPDGAGTPAALSAASPAGAPANRPNRPETYIPDAVAEVIAARGLYRDRPEVAADAAEPESLRWARAAARIADDKLGRGTVLIDVRQVLGITDYFVITNGGNQRQVAAIVEAIEEQLVQQGGPRPYRIEGQSDRAWVLADYVDFVVHVFDPQAREYYDLERLWKDQPYIDWSP